MEAALSSGISTVHQVYIGLGNRQASGTEENIVYIAAVYILGYSKEVHVEKQL